MLFLVKIVRTLNDNFASVFFNAIGLISYFWVGFVMCIFSVFCSYVLIQIHESVIESPSDPKVKQEQENLNEISTVGDTIKNLPS